MPLEQRNKTVFSAVCASRMREPVFFFNEKEIDLLGNARSVVRAPSDRLLPLEFFISYGAGKD